MRYHAEGPIESALSLRALYCMTWPERRRHHADFETCAALLYYPRPMNEDNPAELEPKSKSQRKREASAAQDLGAVLVALPATRFKAIMAKLDLPDSLREALASCRAITALGGRRRQLQYIGKLMRTVDTAPIAHALAVLEGKDRASIAVQHRAEQWRDRLLAEGDTALAELLDDHPHADRQQLRQLVVKARMERVAGQVRGTPSDDSKDATSMSS